MNKEHWTHIIKARTGWFDINLSELWNFRDLILLFVKRDFTSVYKQTILGPLWHFIQPLFSSFIFSFAFAFIAKLSTQDVPPVLFYLSGIVPWSYFADCTNRTSGTFTSNAAIFSKVYFPRLTVPLSVIISNLIKFCIQFILFAGIYLFYYLQGNRSFEANLYLLLTPLLILIMAVFGLGIGLIVSALTIRYRDLSNLVGFGVQLLMYLSSVIFPISMWHEISLKHPKVLWIIYANPMTSIIEAFRFGFLGAGYLDGYQLLYSSLTSFSILIFGLIIFKRVERTFIDTV